MTHEQALAAIATLREHFDNRMNLTPGTVNAWANAITDYPAEAATPAITTLATTLTRPPYLADLREALAAESHRQSSRRGTNHTDELRRIDNMLTRPNLDPEARHTLTAERTDLLRDTREAATELQRDRDTRNPDQPNPTHHPQTR